MKLTAEQSTAWARICASVHRARLAVARAEKRGDEAESARARAAQDRALRRRDAFVDGTGIADRYPPPPQRIVHTSRSPWSNRKSGEKGIHVVEVEMVFDHFEVSGPYWRTIRVLRDEGGPTMNARKPTTYLGVAWNYVASMERRDVVVLERGCDIKKKEI